MEIVIRAVLVFFFLWVITRLIGRATLGELSSFELILFITMGDLIQGAVVGQDSSIVGAVLGVGTFAVLTIGLSWWNARRKAPHRILHGSPVIVARDGEPDLVVMRQEQLSLEEFMAAAREQGIETFGAIRLAILESDGKLSFFTS
ncbi:MAG TPA: YetF domain-containing protein [Beutenbergiaceae bacterium]|nr:YetF domain-containing protein [Beutenbergiaceae bacterium]